MITLEPYLFDNEIYHQVPLADRWIMNKLALAERLGYLCGPSGTNTSAGEYLIRPILNVAGMGTGGIFRKSTPLVGGIPVNDHVPAKGFPGHFWCEAFDGPHQFCEYINDIPQASTKGVAEGNQLVFTETTDFIVLPDFLKNKSRYLLIEAIGAKIIEVSFRHIAACARQSTIDDYRTIDDAYDPTFVQFGFTDMRKVPFGDGWTWENIESTRRPWS